MSQPKRRKREPNPEEYRRYRVPEPDIPKLKGGWRVKEGSYLIVPGQYHEFEAIPDDELAPYEVR